MSVAEIREQIVGLKAEERLALAALLSHLNRADDSEHQSTVDHHVAKGQSGKQRCDYDACLKSLQESPGVPDDMLTIRRSKEL